MFLLSVQVACIFAAVFIFRRLWHRNAYPPPPGPPGLPFIGNLKDIPPMPTWVVYREWSEKYKSKIVRYNVLGSNVVVLNSLQAATDLLEKRSSIYSDRPAMPMAKDLCGFDYGFTLDHYDSRWRARRRAFHSQFQPQIVTRYRPMEEKLAHKLLRRLLETPEDFMYHIRHMAGAEILLLGYGIEVQEHNDPYVQLADDALSCARVCAKAGAYLVDMFPIMKYIPAWFPGAGFQRQAKAWRVPVLGLLNVPYEDYKKRAATGDIPDCAATALLQTLQEFDNSNAPFTEDDIKCALGTMYGAGADTTVSTLQSIMLAMVLYPEVQAKAHAELDRVSPGRLPDFTDYDSLPYIQAIMLEALRWNPVAPEALPHCTTEDDIYEDHFIPQGSVVVANTWAILHDEAHYPDPFTFNPDRYLRPDGTFNPDVLDPGTAAFGYGRRSCPGRWMAQDAMWITVACVLAAFELTKKKDTDGKTIEPSGEYELGFLCYPKPFPCEIRPRSECHAALVRTATATE